MVCQVLCTLFLSSWSIRAKYWQKENHKMKYKKQRSFKKKKKKTDKRKWKSLHTCISMYVCTKKLAHTHTWSVPERRSFSPKCRTLRLSETAVAFTVYLKQGSHQILLGSPPNCTSHILSAVEWLEPEIMTNPETQTGIRKNYPVIHHQGERIRRENK